MDPMGYIRDSVALYKIHQKGPEDGWSGSVVKGFMVVFFSPVDWNKKGAWPTSDDEPPFCEAIGSYNGGVNEPVFGKGV